MPWRRAPRQLFRPPFASTLRSPMQADLKVRLYVLFDLAEQFAFIEYVGSRRAVSGDEDPHFLFMSTVIVEATGGMAHEFAWLQTDLSCVLPRFRAFTRVPRPLQHHAVPLVGMGMRPAHRVGRESVDRQIEPGLARIAFEHHRLHTQFVPLGRVPLELVDVGAHELARRERAELRLTIGARRRRLLSVQRNRRSDQRNGSPRCNSRNFHGTPSRRDYIRAQPYEPRRHEEHRALKRSFSVPPCLRGS